MVLRRLLRTSLVACRLHLREGKTITPLSAGLEPSQLLHPEMPLPERKPLNEPAIRIKTPNSEKQPN
jgi:hypothetical protein